MPARGSHGIAAPVPDLYDDPIAYDILCTPGTSADVDVLQRIARRWVRTRSRRPTWLEPACGTGRYLRVAARRGIRVVGFDRSPLMIAEARRRLHGGRLFVADMARFADRVGVGRIDFAFNLVNSIRHLRSDAAMRAHFADMARVLEPGGVYAVGISFTAYGREPADEDAWEGRRGGCRVQQLVQYLPPEGRARFERVISHLTIERGRRAEHRDAVYLLRCYDERQWLRLLARSALRRQAVLDVRGRPIERRVLPYAIEILAPRATSE